MQRVMNTLNRLFKCTLVLAAATVFVASSTIEAKDQTTYSDQEFEEALATGIDRTGSASVETDKGPVDIVAGAEEIEVGWKVMINGVWQVSSSSVQILTYPAVVVNHGDRMELVFYGQPVGYPLLEGIRHHKGMLKAEKAWKKKYKDVEVVVGSATEGGSRIMLSISYSYADGVSKNDIAERLKYMFGACHGILVWSEHARRDVEKDYVKGLTEKKLDYLTMAGLVYLFDDDLEDYFNDDLDDEEGNWFFTYEERPVYIANQGSRVVLNYHYDVPEEVAGANRQNVLDAAKKFVGKNEIKLASSREITWYDEEAEDSVWLTVTFELDGSFKGKDFKKAYFEYYEKYTGKLEKAIEKAIDKNS